MGPGKSLGAASQREGFRKSTGKSGEFQLRAVTVFRHGMHEARRDVSLLGIHTITIHIQGTALLKPYRSHVYGFVRLCTARPATHLATFSFTPVSVNDGGRVYSQKRVYVVCPVSYTGVRLRGCRFNYQHFFNASSRGPTTRAHVTSTRHVRVPMCHEWQTWLGTCPQLFSTSRLSVRLPK